MTPGDGRDYRQSFVCLHKVEMQAPAVCGYHTKQICIQFMLPQIMTECDMLYVKVSNPDPKYIIYL